MRPTACEQTCACENQHDEASLCLEWGWRTRGDSQEQPAATLGATTPQSLADGNGNPNGVPPIMEGPDASALVPPN
jgi:hypothetical protein